MGCSTIGFIATKKKDVFEIRAGIMRALKKFRNIKGTGIYTGREITSDINADFRLCDGFFVVTFYDFEDQRALFVHFGCDGDCDAAHIGPKVIFSLGAWGNSENIIKIILNEFKGKRYCIDNDCSGEWILMK